MSGAILVGFYLLAITVSITLMIFVGFNVPLIIFHYSLKVFDILAGGDLVRVIVFGDEFNWTVGNTFFVIYATIFVFSLIIFLGIFVWKLTNKVYTFGDEKTQPSFMTYLKWFFAYIFGLVLIPMAFFIINLLTQSLLPIFSSTGILSTRPSDMDYASFLSSIEFNKTQISTYIEGVQKLKDIIETNKQGFSDYYGESVIDDLLISADNLIKNGNDLLTQLDGLNFGTVDFNQQQVDAIKYYSEALSKYMNDANSFNSSFNHLNKPLENLDTTEAFKIMLTSDGDTILSLLMYKKDGYYPVGNYAYYLSGSYDGTQDITKLLYEKFTDGRIYTGEWDLFNPFSFFNITNLFQMMSPKFGTIIARLVLTFPCLTIISTTFIWLNIKIFKRVITILFLLISSPMVTVSAIANDGVIFQNWCRKSIASFGYIVIATIGINLFRILAPLFIEWVDTAIPGNSGNGYSSFANFLGVFVGLVAATLGINKIIEISAGYLNESSSKNNDKFSGMGSGATKTIGSNFNSFAGKSDKLFRKSAGTSMLAADKTASALSSAKLGKV